MKTPQRRPNSRLRWYRGKLQRKNGVVLIRWEDSELGIHLLEARDGGQKRLHFITPDGEYFRDEESAIARVQAVLDGQNLAEKASRYVVENNCL